MPIKLMYITNQPKVATIAESSGVDWIFLDMETRGKVERQGQHDTVISNHTLNDVKTIRNSISNAQLLVRVNPIYSGSKEEIEKVIDSGADIIMLPYFLTVREVETFICFINGRVKTCLLFETPNAVTHIDEILNLSGIDYVHIGLNDLHLGYNMKFMFELLTDGTVEMLCRKFRNKNITYGFGGIARLGHGAVPAENVIGEHYRLGSEMAILSRSFFNMHMCDDLWQVENILKQGIAQIREYENWLKKQDYSWYKINQKMTQTLVKKVTQKMSNGIVANRII